MALKIKYNNKIYTDIKDTLNDAIIERIETYLKVLLKPFEKEIAKYNGIVTINIPKDFKNAKIEITNIPKDLRDKILSVLAPK